MAQLHYIPGSDHSCLYRYFKCSFEHVKSKFYCVLNTLLHRARGTSELVSVQLLKIFLCSCYFVCTAQLFRLSSMLDDLIKGVVFRIFKCSSTSDIWFIRSMFDLEAIGVMLERRQSNLISKFRGSVSYADVILRCI